MFTTVPYITHSHGETQNLTTHHAQTPQATVIKVGRSDYVVDPYTCAKVCHDPPRGFVSAHAWLCTPKRVSFFFLFSVFLGVLATRYSQGP